VAAAAAAAAGCRQQADLCLTERLKKTLMAMQWYQ
jgi:hypothetical protein